MNGRFTISFLFYILFSVGSVMGQNFLTIDKSMFGNNTNEGKMAYLKIKEAQKYCRKGISFTPKSLALFLEAHSVNQKCPELNFNIGLCYLMIGPKTKALPFLLSAESANPEISEDINFLIGLTYQYNNDFSNAIIHFKTNMELILQKKHKSGMELISLCEKHIEECRNGKLFQEKESINEIELIAGDINSEFDEFNPLQIDEDFFFSSRRGVDGVDFISNKDQKFYENIYKIEDFNIGSGKVYKDNSGLDKESNSAICSKLNENQFVLYRSNSGEGDLFLAEKYKGEWKFVKKIKFLNRDDSRESSASFSQFGNEVYFVSDRKGGYGNCDIYFCIKNSNGKWLKPVNIGGDINTEYDEADVFVTPAGNELYFSSKGHDSMGGYDIFKCEKDSLGVWGKPENLGLPINSTDNDISFSISQDGKFYFASERDGGIGGFDIYTQKITLPKIAQEVVLKMDEDSIPEVISQKIEPAIIPDFPVKSFDEGYTQIQMKQELVEEDFVYRIQIAACKNEMKAEDLFKRYKGGDVVEHLFVNGWHKYTIGGFASFEEAAKYRDVCGVNDAFVVLFKGGFRLGIAQKPVRIK